MWKQDATSYKLKLSSQRWKWIKYFSTLSEMGINQNVRNGVLPNFNAELHNNIKGFWSRSGNHDKGNFWKGLKDCELWNIQSDVPAFRLKEGTQWKREHIVDILLFNGREMWSVNQQWNPFLYWSWWFKNILLKSISFCKISLLHLMDNGSLERKFYQPQNVTKRGWFGYSKCKIELDHAT